ncbi:restriction endonuclease subunit S [Ligilactobacillus murinus]|uniref:restriction endonuclease subunit S n=1 Tax=Ligilactobacillus murinus TaxID=1622 RepID=UPI002DD6615F|nr:restriction endonuclease subunit S [Ligilactobacillus murinus]WRY36851.1 restriction endonuclease subunit S [Ligilactobacillus murinus]
MPDGWEWARINKIYWNLGQKKPDSKFYYLDTGAVNNSIQKLNKSNIKQFEIEEAPSRARKIVQRNSIIFSTVRSYLKNIAVVDVSNTKNYIASTAFIVLDSLFDTEFLLNLLISKNFLLQVEQKSTGSNYPAINERNFNSLFVPVPPIGEQKRIGFKIRKLFNNIEHIEGEQEQLQQLATQLKQKVLDVAMQGKLVPQDPNDEPASVLLEKIRAEKQRLYEEGKIKKKDLVETEIVKDGDNAYYQNLPKGWGKTLFGNIVYLLSGRDLSVAKYSDSVQKGIPYITGASNFCDGIITTSRFTEFPTVISEKKDILITVKGTVGELAVNPYYKAHIARQIMAIRPYLVNNEFLKIYLETKIDNMKLQSQSMIPGISREVLLKLLIALPPKTEQLRITNLIKKLFQEFEEIT